MSPSTYNLPNDIAPSPGLAGSQGANSELHQPHETRAQPWMNFANPTAPAHRSGIAQARSLSVVGLEKSELVNYAAENR